MLVNPTLPRDEIKLHEMSNAIVKCRTSLRHYGIRTQTLVRDQSPHDRSLFAKLVPGSRYPAFTNYLSGAAVSGMWVVVDSTRRMLNLPTEVLQLVVLVH